MNKIKADKAYLLVPACLISDEGADIRVNIYDTDYCGIEFDDRVDALIALPIVTMTFNRIGNGAMAAHIIPRMGSDIIEELGGATYA